MCGLLWLVTMASSLHGCADWNVSIRGRLSCETGCPLTGTAHVNGSEVIVDIESTVSFDVSLMGLEAFGETLYYPAPGQETRSPTPTGVTTTRNTRKPDHCWRQWWRIRWTRQWFLYSRIDILHASFFPFTLSRMRNLNTQIFWMSTIYLRPLLWTSTNAPSVWLSKMLKLVTSTIVGNIVMNSFSSFTCAYHALPYSFSFMINMHLLQGKHAFYICLLHFYLMFYMCSPQG